MRVWNGGRDVVLTYTYYLCFAVNPGTFPGSRHDRILSGKSHLYSPNTRGSRWGKTDLLYLKVTSQ